MAQFILLPCSQVFVYKLGRRAPGIYCLFLHGSPGFVGNLGTAIILVRVAQSYIAENGSYLHLQVAALFSQAVLYALGKVGKPPEGRITDSTTARI